MAMFEQSGAPEKDRSRLIMLLSGIAVLVVIGLIVLAASIGNRRPALEMARAGSAEFDGYSQFVAINIVHRRWGERLGTRYGRIICYVHNNGDRVLSGLELRAAAIGFDDEVFKEKVITPVPSREDRLGPNGRIDLDIYLEPIPDPAEVRDMVIELRGLKLE